MKVCLLSKVGGGGPIIYQSFLDFMLVIVYNLYSMYLKSLLLFYSVTLVLEYLVLTLALCISSLRNSSSNSSFV